ncbi:MAG TPA: serine hydrolase [Pyrinomonadaceae bacterium]|nr:serine hydrolase [Pyrinomonadaceae bacterium]
MRIALAFCMTVLLIVVSTPSEVRAQQLVAQGLSTGDEARLVQFQNSLDAMRVQYKIPGLSAAIVSNRQVVWAQGFGYQDMAGAIPATPDTPYLIASLTKTFTSMLLMKCVEEGRLNLDDPILKYSAVIQKPGVTVRHVFTHTSESTPPGEAYQYNGSLFGELTPVVKSCMGLPYQQVVAQAVLDKIGMPETVPGLNLLYPTPDLVAMYTPEALARYVGVLQHLAKPYKLDGRGQIIPSVYPRYDINASAGLISTVRDLALYDAAIDRHLLLQSQIQEQAWTNPINSGGQTLPYGLGWFVQNYGGERLIWHYGSWPDAFSALILKVPRRNVTLILLANSGGLSNFNALGAGNVAGSPFASLFLQMLNDPAAFAGNPIDDAQTFVAEHYSDFLNREPDNAGLGYWTNEIARCGADQLCLQQRRIGVSAAFFIENEFQKTGSFIYRVYKGSLGRQPTYAEFTADRSRIVVGDALEASLAAFAAEWVTRAEFKAAYPDGMPPTDFVNKLFDTAALAPYTTERQQQIQAMTLSGKTRAQVIRDTIEMLEFRNKEYNPAFVLMQYFGYLKRDPERGGYNFWLNVLNNREPNNYRGMVCSFITSAEYQLRFSSTITHSNRDCAP